jgi:cation diffusion facilitator CzcD-associated flavoprotein CzcO
VSVVTGYEPPTEAELREKYRLERDKRLRDDGNDQYIEPVGRYAHFREDPYVPRVERDPVIRDVEVAIIGAGFAGLNAGARLREAGVDDVWLIDPAGDVGGAWYWNRYPGAMCDTAAMIYLPLLEETNYQPSAKYTKAPEIFAHAQRIATTFGLYEHALFSTEVTDLRWIEEDSRWLVTTDRGDKLRARFVAAGTGPLNRPKLPGIDGIETYEGHAFHTSRWDYDYTGGDASGAPMTNLANKKVGIIGTGATAIQCIPSLARDAGELFVFQRTPSSIDVRNNKPIDAEWFSTLEPGWQRKWQLNFCTLQTGGFADEDLVMDGWTDISQRIRDKVVERLAGFSELDPDVMKAAYEESDDEKMVEIRRRVDDVVKDGVTAQALKPWYRQLCKRPCFHDEYLDSYNVPTCHLVDTDGHGVEKIDATGVWVNGTHYELDCLIFASGFEVGTEVARRAGYETTGRDGLTLTEYWVDGMRSLHGNYVRNFPNYFILGFAQGANLLSNVTHNLSDCAVTIAKVIDHARESGHTVVEPTDVAEKEWVELMAQGRQTIFGDPDCTPGYYNNEGRPLDTAYNFAAAGYPLGAAAFFDFVDQWRNTGEFSGLTFSLPAR